MAVEFRDVVGLIEVGTSAGKNDLRPLAREKPPQVAQPSPLARVPKGPLISVGQVEERRSATG